MFGSSDISKRRAAGILIFIPVGPHVLFTDLRII